MAGEGELKQKNPSKAVLALEMTQEQKSQKILRKTGTQNQETTDSQSSLSAFVCKGTLKHTSFSASKSTYNCSGHKEMGFLFLSLVPNSQGLGQTGSGSYVYLWPG